MGSGAKILIPQLPHWGDNSSGYAHGLSSIERGPRTQTCGNITQLEPTIKPRSPTIPRKTKLLLRPDNQQAATAGHRLQAAEKPEPKAHRQCRRAGKRAD